MTSSDLPVQGRIVARKFRTLDDGTIEFTGEDRVVEGDDVRIDQEAAHKLLRQQNQREEGN